MLIKVLGCGVFAVGIWMQANRDSFSVVLPSHSFLTAASLVIIAGAITLVIGFVGCCGAIAENKCMMVVVSFVSLCICFLYPKCLLLIKDVCNYTCVRIWVIYERNVKSNHFTLIRLSIECLIQSVSDIHWSCTQVKKETILFQYFIFVLVIFGLEVAATALILSYQKDVSIKYLHKVHVFTVYST